MLTEAPVSKRGLFADLESSASCRADTVVSALIFPSLKKKKWIKGILVIIHTLGFQRAFPL